MHVLLIQNGNLKICSMKIHHFPIFAGLFLIFFFQSCRVTSLNSKNTSHSSVNKVVTLARKYTGTPYKFGGNDSNGIDCSGLLCNVFNDLNIKIPRVSFQQAETFPANDIQFIAKGDLVFFVTSGSEISHAGIVTEVKNEREVMFIHASTSKGVREDNLFSNYWLSRFARVCRPKYN